MPGSPVADALGGVALVVLAAGLVVGAALGVAGAVEPHPALRASVATATATDVRELPRRRAPRVDRASEAACISKVSTLYDSAIFSIRAWRADPPCGS